MLILVSIVSNESCGRVLLSSELRYIEVSEQSTRCVILFCAKNLTGTCVFIGNFVSIFHYVFRTRRSFHLVNVIFHISRMYTRECSIATDGRPRRGKHSFPLGQKLTLQLAICSSFASYWSSPVPQRTSVWTQ